MGCLYESALVCQVLVYAPGRAGLQDPGLDPGEGGPELMGTKGAEHDRIYDLDLRYQVLHPGV